LFIFPIEKGSIVAEMKAMNWSSLILGLAAIFANVAVTLLLIPVGIYFFKDKITFTNAVGVILSIIGIFLINKE